MIPHSNRSCFVFTFHCFSFWKTTSCLPRNKYSLRSSNTEPNDPKCICYRKRTREKETWNGNEKDMKYSAQNQIAILVGNFLDQGFANKRYPSFASRGSLFCSSNGRVMNAIISIFTIRPSSLATRLWWSEYSSWKSRFASFIDEASENLLKRVWFGGPITIVSVECGQQF